jgi:hypothetical protein
MINEKEIASTLEKFKGLEKLEIFADESPPPNP